MIKRALYFFTPDDEKELSEALLSEFPFLKFVDGQRWESSIPPVAGSIAQCTSATVYLWPSNLVPSLPYQELPESRRYEAIRFQGPTSGPVMQFCRCRVTAEAVEMGECSAFIQSGDCPVSKSHTAVISLMKALYHFSLDCLNIKTDEVIKQGIQDYLVGPSLRKNKDQLRRLVLGIGRNEYLVPSR